MASDAIGKLIAQTMPGKSYFVFMRLYGPLESWFDKSWKPGDFELLT